MVAGRAAAARPSAVIVARLICAAHIIPPLVFQSFAENSSAKLIHVESGSYALAFHSRPHWHIRALFQDRAVGVL